MNGFSGTEPRRRAWLPLAASVGLAVLALGCGQDAASTGAATTASAAASAPGSAASPAMSASAPKPRTEIASAKPFGDTAAAELGTLPEGVGIAVGAKAPEFALVGLNEEKVKLSELLKKSEVLLVFYRGGW